MAELGGVANLISGMLQGYMQGKQFQQGQAEAEQKKSLTDMQIEHMKATVKQAETKLRLDEEQEKRLQETAKTDATYKQGLAALVARMMPGGVAPSAAPSGPFDLSPRDFSPMGGGSAPSLNLGVPSHAGAPSPRVGLSMDDKGPRVTLEERNGTEGEFVGGDGKPMTGYFVQGKLVPGTERPKYVLPQMRRELSPSGVTNEFPADPLGNPLPGGPVRPVEGKKPLYREEVIKGVKIKYEISPLTGLPVSPLKANPKLGISIPEDTTIVEDRPTETQKKTGADRSETLIRSYPKGAPIGDLWGSGGPPSGSPPVPPKRGGAKAPPVLKGKASEGTPTTPGGEILTPGLQDLGVDKEGARAYRMPDGSLPPEGMTPREIAAKGGGLITPQQAEIEGAIGVAKSVVTQLGELSLGKGGIFIGVTPGVVNRVKLAGANYYEELAQNPGQGAKLAQYNNIKESFAGALARTVMQEKGVLTQPDIVRVMKAFPVAYPLPDTEVVARVKMTALEQFLTKLERSKSVEESRGYIEEMERKVGGGGGKANHADPDGIR